MYDSSSASDSQAFVNELFGTVRSIIGPDGEPWFVGKDIATCLGYKYPANAIQDHVDIEDRWGRQFTDPTEEGWTPQNAHPTGDMWGGQNAHPTGEGWESRFATPTNINNIPSPPIYFIDKSGRQQVQYPVWINESGVYSLIFSSRLPAAREFKKWVVSILKLMRNIGFERSQQLLVEENNRLQQENMNLKDGIENMYYDNRRLFKNNFDLKKEVERLNDYNVILSTPEGSINSYISSCNE